MQLERRRFLTLSAATAMTSAAAPPAAAATTTSTCAFGVDGAQYGLHPGSPDDQTAAFQRAVNETARTRRALALAPGVYRVADIKLPTGTNIIGARGATRLVLTDGPFLLSASHADLLTLTGLVLDGGGRRLPSGHGLVQLESARSVKIIDCEITGAGGNAIRLLAVAGEITRTKITSTLDAAIISVDAGGLLIARNVITGAGNNGIQVWRSKSGADGTIVSDNRIESVKNRSGGNGQYGNAINVFRADNVIVRGNSISNCAYSAVRGNSASNLQIVGNSVSNAREVALYAEFEFTGAVIANNIVDVAAVGVSVTNFNVGGRLAVVQGNIIRNLLPKRPDGTDPNDGAGIGIAAEADTVVTGNVIESAPYAGIVLGWGQYLRDVAATDNVVRNADIGIAASVTHGAGTALIANNIISNVKRGGVLGVDKRKVVTGDLLKSGADHYANIILNGNRGAH